jgi:hypothetical protein
VEPDPDRTPHRIDLTAFGVAGPAAVDAPAEQLDRDGVRLTHPHRGSMI